jgi:uncharacterized membrane protein (DUF4010 family)
LESTPEWLNFLSPFLRGLLTATGIGLIIGLEREHSSKQDDHPIGGARTFPLLCILGFIAGYVGKNYQSALLPAALAGLFILVAVAYYVQARNDRFGLTTEFALIAVFLLGVLPAYDHNLDALAAAVVVTVLLSLKEEFKGFMARITKEELSAYVKFIVLAILLLPWLPDQNFGPEGQLNYRDLGWIVVLVSAISLVGYLLLKFIGLEKGILITALVGGLFSSTMIAWVFAARSREAPAMARTLGAGIVLSSTVMPFRILFLTWLFNRALTMQLLLPCVLALAVSLGVVWFVLRTDQRKKKAERVGEFPLGNPLDLKNALFFAGLYIAITLLMFYSQQWFGTAGAYITALISGVADMDAITISTARWPAASLSLAANVIVVAAMSNTLFKAVVSVTRGDPALRPVVLMGFGAVLAVVGVWFGLRLV